MQQSPENLADAAVSLTSLRLVQTLTSGPDAVLAAGFSPHVQITSGRSLHDGPVAEHALALTLAAIRRLDLLMKAQRASHWSSSYLDAQRAPDTRELYTLAGARVGVWGFGSIARRLAPMLDLLGATVVGIAGSAGERGGYPVISPEQLFDTIGEFDVLISLLPATAQTHNALDRDLISRMKPTVVFVNVGRGATVDEAALVDALRSGGIRVAALDVMSQEPLPASSSLWSVPNLILSPHAAGNRPHGAGELIVRNAQALRANAAPMNVVPRGPVAAM